MAGKAASGSKKKVVMAETEAAYQAVETSVALYEATAETARSQLYLALDALFTFGESQRNRTVGANNRKEPVLKGFVESRDVRWGKVAQENPYHALVKIAFPKAGEASRSQYSRVLHFAHDVLEKGASFSTWLNGFDGKLEGAYLAAVKHFTEPSKRDLKEAMRSQRLDRARERLSRHSVSAPFALTAPLNLQDGYVVALVRVDGGAQAQIVEFVEQDQQRIEDTLLRFAEDVEAEIAVLMDRPLFALFNAVDLLDEIVPPGKVAGKRRIVIANSATDCRVFTATSDYVGPWAELVLPAPLPHLTPGTLYALLEPDAARFREQFRADGEWSLLPPTTGTSDCRLTSSAANTDEVSLAPLVLDGSAALYVGNPPAQRARPFALRHQSMVDFVDAYQTLKAGVLKPSNSPSTSKGSGKGRPRLTMGLEWQSGVIRGAPLGVLGVAFDLFSMADDPQIPKDRYLGLRDFNRLCEAVIPYGVDLHGWLVDSADGVSHAGLLLRHDFDGSPFQALLPLHISTDLVYAETAKSLEGPL